MGHLLEHWHICYCCILIIIAQKFVLNEEHWHMCAWCRVTDNTKKKETIALDQTHESLKVFSRVTMRGRSRAGGMQPCGDKGCVRG